jgi:hypothetical protein
MGTSCPGAYTMLYWAYVEWTYIIPKWEPHLPFLKRFIKDKFGIWLGTNEILLNLSTKSILIVSYNGLMNVWEIMLIPLT